MKAVARLAGPLLARVLAGCSPAYTPVPLPSGSELVVQWHRFGGFTAAGTRLIDPPRLAVYADGRAIADASKVLTLSRDEVGRLLNEIGADLAGLPAVVTADTDEQVMDAPSTEITVRTADGSPQVVRAEALGILRGYPGRLVAAQDRLSELAERVGQEGTPYTADRVRLVTDPRDGDAGPAQPWPAEIPVPAPSGAGGVSGMANLDGAAAAAVQRQLGPARYDAHAWQLVRLDDGKLVAVSWRFLLPHE